MAWTNDKTGPLNGTERRQRDAALRKIAEAMQTLNRLGVWTIDMEHAEACGAVQQGCQDLQAMAVADDIRERPRRSIG